MIEQAEVETVQPGDVVEFENRGQRFGGVVWRAPSSGDLLAGDTFLTLRGKWLPATHVVSITRRGGASR